MSQYVTAQVAELLKWKGEKFVSGLLSGFSCPQNKDVESFLRNHAIDFTDRRASITHLVFDTQTADCVGYFILTHKPFTFEAGHLSKSEQKRASRFAQLDAELNTFTLSAFLIAQFAKNHTLPVNRRIDGSILMSVVFDKVRQIQAEVGGQAVFLECEDGCPGLLSFYERNGFKLCSTRVSATDGRKYLQLLAFVR